MPVLFLRQLKSMYSTMEQSAPVQTKEVVTKLVRAEWFVLSTCAGNERSKQMHLEEKCGLRCFVPMRRVRKRLASGRFCYRQTVAVPHYIFVQATSIKLEKLRAVHPRLFENLHVVKREKWSEGQAKMVPLTIPRDQMDNFIAVAGNEEEHVRFLDPQALDLRKGERVRILGGPFEGVEGIYLRINKQHAKYVVVQIEGISAVATTALPSVLVERIGKNDVS